VLLVLMGPASLRGSTQCDFIRWPDLCRSSPGPRCRGGNLAAPEHRGPTPPGEFDVGTFNRLRTTSDSGTVLYSGEQLPRCDP